jgi:YD repeat-containing protein
LRLEDEPLGYQPPRGPRVGFQLSYRQRGVLTEDPTVFGVGNNWSCSFRAFVGNSSGAPGLLFLHRGGAGYIYYTNDVTQARDGSILTAITNGYQIAYADGSTDLFQFPFVNGSGDQIYFLSSRSDPAGNALTFNYQTNGGVLQLTSVSDPDSPQPTTLHYENSTFANRITRVVDPFGRTAILQYDANGYLTNIVDVATNSSSLAYDPAGTGWITTLTTPYGATSFRYGGVDSNSSTFYTVGNVVNRFVDVTLPTLGHYLYLYRQDCSGFMPQTYANWLVPTNVPAGSTLAISTSGTGTASAGIPGSMSTCRRTIRRNSTTPIFS